MIRRVVYRLMCLLMAISTGTLTIRGDESTAAPGVKVPVSLDDIFDNFNPLFLNATWMSDTELLYGNGEQILKFNVTTQTSQVITTNALFNETGLKFYSSPDKNYVLIRNTTETVYRFSILSIFSIYNIETKRIEALADGQLLSTAFWAPEGSALVYVLKNDIYYHQLRGNATETRRVTLNGQPLAVYNGVPDWVYQEEVYESDRAMWFSPSGEHLAFATFNDTQVSEMVITRYGEPGSLKDQYSKQKTYRYPKVGTTNPQVTLNLVDLTDHESSLVSLKAPVDIVGSEPILFAVRWFDAKTLVATWTNRVQNLSQIVSYSLDGQLQPLLTQESPGGWILYPRNAPIYHSSYVYLQKPQLAENASLGLFSHVTRFRLLNGVLDNETDLTPGEFWVHKIYGVSVVKRVVYFTATPPGEPSQRHLYEVGIANKDAPEAPNCVSCKFKSPEGNACKFVSLMRFSPSMSHVVLTCAGPDPMTVRVYDLDVSYELYSWVDNSQLRQFLTKRILPKQMDLNVESHGFNSKVRLYLPQDFDESKKYPMLVYVFTFPGHQLIDDEFNFGFEKYITTSRHVIVAVIDGRGSGSRGTALLYTVYRNLGNAGIDDQITVTKKLQQKFPWIDSNRTGVWGVSYGGYSTAKILTKDDDNVFKCGISINPITDWIYYNSIFTERYMGLPTVDDNLKNYQLASVMERVEMLRGKKFMLLYGTNSDLEHYEHSMALSKALAKADILYEQVIYPDEDYVLSLYTKHLGHTLDKFFSECFGYDWSQESGSRKKRDVVKAFAEEMARES